ncbi:LysR family transcriptional regulator [Undibacterium sp. Tian12W]|uniref:LysR family transcriptional regulator n=1 Tax=Undibacterium sp. Tian12W TaxID=3413054 RepID=UPI003BF443E8
MPKKKLPSLTLLSGFEAAARHGNFSRAADELHLSQSAISHQVQQLEEQLKQPLFRRVGRGVELNVAGETLLSSVQRAMTVLQAGLGQIATYLDPGLVVVNCPEHIAHGWLQARLARLQERLPDLCMMLSTDMTARFVDEVDVDISISDRPLLQEGLTELPWLQDSWVVLASKSLAGHINALPASEHHLHAGLLCLEQSLTDETTASLFLQELAHFRKLALFDDVRLLLDAVQRGRGIACLPRLLAEESLQNSSLCMLDGYQQIAGQTWYLSGMVTEPRTDIVKQVFDWLQAEAKK